jgi:cytochrome oxidase Cu insertion factor (SCO1/SenC/PrrC family)
MLAQEQVEAGTARRSQEARVRIAGEEQHEPAGTAAPADPAALGAAVAARRSARRRRMWITLGVVAVLLIGLNGYVAYVLARANNANAGANLRPSGIPRNISTSIANLMQLSPVPGVRAPGFTLTDQNGHTMSLASLRGKVVVLEFMDPHCTDICPIVSQEFVDAYHKLGPQADKVVFAAINVNQYHATVANMAAFSDAQRLDTIPGWHFFTGAVPALQTAWRDYDIEVSAPNPNADIIHTSSVYFIDARGRERFVASPMVDHTAGGASYLPLAQISDWAGAIAGLAKDLAR